MRRAVLVAAAVGLLLCTAIVSGISGVRGADLACPKVFYLDADTAQCAPCGPGSFQPAVGAVGPGSCVACGAGRSSAGWNESSALACAPCTPGTFQSSSGGAVCQGCSPGFWQAEAGAVACRPCPADTYQNQWGAALPSACTPCPDAAPYSLAGTGSVLQCTQGIGCPPGIWTAPGAGQSCTDSCPPGSFCQGGVRALCAQGSFASEKGATECVPCGAGRYTASNGSTSAGECLSCPSSTYSALATSRSCTPCPPGSFSPAGSVGSPSNSTCLPLAGCLTAALLLSTDSHTGIDPGGVQPGVKFCPYGSSEAIELSPLLPGGAWSMRSFMLQISELQAEFANMTSTGQDGHEAAEAVSAAVADAVAFWVPSRMSASLRLAAFGSDETLDHFGATHPASSNTTSPSASKGEGGLSTSALLVMSTLFVLLAFGPWVAFRFLPAKAAYYLDQFSLNHYVPSGEAPLNLHTQFGAVASWAFGIVAIFVVVLLASASNTSSSTVLLPPSVTPFAGSARASFQFTLRVYTGAAFLDWCDSSNGGIMPRRLGFSDAFTLAVRKQGQSCAIKADCLGCAISDTAVVSFTVPYNAQLIEHELWANSAQPGAWSRAYGVWGALGSDVLLEAQAEAHFTTVESYFVDTRSKATFTEASPRTLPPGERATSTGFEFAFNSFLTDEAQPLSTWNANSTVTLSFILNKSGIVLQSTLSSNLSQLQQLAVIASSIVSLFSLFALGFRLVEGHILSRLNVKSGAVAVFEGDDGEDVFLLHEHEQQHPPHVPPQEANPEDAPSTAAYAEMKSASSGDIDLSQRLVATKSFEIAEEREEPWGQFHANSE